MADNRMLDHYGLHYRPMMSDAEDVNTANVVNAMMRNQQYEASPFGRINAMLTRQTDALEGTSGFNPVNMMLEGAKTANRWLGAVAGYGDRVQTQDILAPLGMGAMVAPFMSRNALGSAGAKMATAAGAEPQGIRAYHGSPHDFGRFDMSKIGTGEGAQAFGHGLYFAESEGVAKSYRDALSDNWTPKMKFRGYATQELRALGHPQTFADHAVERIERAIDQGQSGDDVLAAIDRVSAPEPYKEALRAAVRDALPLMEKYPKQQGHLYEVNIRANPDEFLDWDKPLSQQSDKVRKTLADAGIATTAEVKPDLWRVVASDGTILQEYQARQQANRYLQSDSTLRIERMPDEVDKSVAELVRNQHRSGVVNDDVDERKISAILREAGVPGIRYLDGSSRSAGEGSRNFVLFRDDIIDIVKKYGIAAAVSTYGLDAVQGAMAEQNGVE